MGVEKSKINVTVDVKNLSNIKNMANIILENIKENNGVISNYNRKLLSALLNRDYHEEFIFNNDLGL